MSRFGTPHPRRGLVVPLLIVLAAGSLLLTGCVGGEVGVGYEAPVYGVDYYEPYGYYYGDWGPDYYVAPYGYARAYPYDHPHPDHDGHRGPPASHGHVPSYRAPAAGRSMPSLPRGGGGGRYGGKH